MKTKYYIITVVIVMALLMITRVQYFLTTPAVEMQIVFFTIVELVLLIWGVVLLVKKRDMK